MAKYTLKEENFNILEHAIKNCADKAEYKINTILHNDGAELIEDSIMRLLPISNKKWKGKHKNAKYAKSLGQRTDKKGNYENLAVTVGTTNNYHYLYFPDDGSNTKRHIGGQGFMLRGAQQVSDEIINRCIKNLTTIEEME